MLLLRSLQLRILALAILAGATSSLASGRASAEALILVDVTTGKVLQAENATYPWYPASVTKLMTTYTTLRAVRQGRITLDSLFTV
jgi:D-alanyl-D-alanine carboxypeptidase